MDTPTENQFWVYKYIKIFIDMNGYPPSLREIADYFNIKSTNGVRCHLQALERKGYLQLASGVARGIKCLK